VTELARTQIESKDRWDEILGDLGRSHFLQSWDWGELKSKYGWSALRLAWSSAGVPVAAAQVLTRGLKFASIRLPVRIQYVPRGPLLDWENAEIPDRVLDDLANHARDEGALLSKIDPEIPADQTKAIQLLDREGWIVSPDQVQFKNTVVLDLSPSADEIMAGMKQKTRYNIRLASRRGVEIRLGDLNDFDLLYDLYAQTSARDGFVIRHSGYYRDVWGKLISADMAQIFIAEFERNPVAALIVVRFSEVSYFLYGMSSGEHRDKMPNHLLQWEAIRWAKREGCLRYDLWGAPDEFKESDPLWGVYRFKSGFGGTVQQTIGAYDYPTNRMLYNAYTRILPAALSLMRRRGHAQTRALLE
jgi:lipid II:glycine glycyltransferase (peptidoglycan interpeptide bridge formation enzyme)